MDDFDKGLLFGILIGEGHFGGDGKQAQVTLRMHSRHESLFKWLLDKVPGSRLYGPYNHGGRSYYQWMARGESLRVLATTCLDKINWGTIDSYSAERYELMKRNYPRAFTEPGETASF